MQPPMQNVTNYINLHLMYLGNGQRQSETDGTFGSHALPVMTAQYFGFVIIDNACQPGM